MAAARSEIDLPGLLEELIAATAETGLGDLPGGCPWTPEQVQDMAWLPASGAD